MLQAQEVLLAMLNGMVKNPEDIETHVSKETDNEGEYTLINVKLNEKDIGVCIGVGGETAEAIRKIINIVGYKELNERVYVKIDAPKLPKSHFFNKQD